MWCRIWVQSMPVPFLCGVILSHAFNKAQVYCGAYAYDSDKMRKEGNESYISIILFNYCIPVINLHISSACLCFQYNLKKIQIIRAPFFIPWSYIYYAWTYQYVHWCWITKYIFIVICAYMKTYICTDKCSFQTLLSHNIEHFQCFRGIVKHQIALLSKSRWCIIGFLYILQSLAANLRHGDAHMNQLFASSLFHVMACCLFSNEPLPGQILTNCHFDLWAWTYWNQNMKIISVTNLHLKLTDADHTNLDIF